MKNLPYNRNDRIAKQIYQTLVDYIYKNMDDERLERVQFTRATLTKDFSIARIYFYVDGDEKKQKKCLQSLRDIEKDLKRVIATELSLRLTPKLEFYPDEGMENAKRIDEIIDEIHKDN